MDYRIKDLDTVESTNALVKEALRRGDPEGLVLRAQSQSGGYGRQGRLWSSPKGGLYQSMALRPPKEPQELPTLGLVVALVFRETLESFVPEFPGMFTVKWPNDVLVLGQKILGISVEATGGGVCVGTGANVWRPKEPLAIAGKNTPAYLEDYRSWEDSKVALVHSLSERFLDAFALAYERWITDGFSSFYSDYEDHHCLTGASVTLDLPSGGRLGSGTVRGITDRGELLVESQGILAAFTSGEVHLAIENSQELNPGSFGTLALEPFNE